MSPNRDRSFVSVHKCEKKLRYRRGTARRTMSAEILSTAAQLYEKSHSNRLALGNDLEGDSRSSELPLFDRPYITSY